MSPHRMRSRIVSRHILSAGIALVYAAPLAAAPDGAANRDCTSPDSLKNRPAVEAGKVAGTDKRIAFIKSETDDKRCPAATPACRRKAFVVPGNTVVVSGRTGDYVCATYVNGRGVETSGWLPKAAVRAETPGDALPWPGMWIRDEATVTIKVDGKGNLAVSGDATFGAHDSDRVKRGGVNVGEISAKVMPTGDRLSFSMGDNDKTLPVDKSDDMTCKVWMQRVGDYLLVDDNNACGGMNVSFRGTYARK